MSSKASPFPQIEYEYDVAMPERSSRDANPVTQDQIDTIESLVNDLNRFNVLKLDIDRNLIDELGSAQANKFIRELKSHREKLFIAWRSSVKGRKETIKGKGIRISVTVNESDEEPTAKQIGYLKHLLEERNVRDFPEYLYTALGKWDVSELIDALQVSDSGKGNNADKKEKSSGCGCLLVIIIISIIAWIIWESM